MPEIIFPKIWGIWFSYPPETFLYFLIQTKLRPLILIWFDAYYYLLFCGSFNFACHFTNLVFHLCCFKWISPVYVSIYANAGGRAAQNNVLTSPVGVVVLPRMQTATNRLWRSLKGSQCRDPLNFPSTKREHVGLRSGGRLSRYLIHQQPLQLLLLASICC